MSTHQDDVMSALLNQLRCLSYGSTQNWAPTRGGEKDTTGHPPGDLYPAHEFYGNRYNAATDDMRRQRVIDDARDHLGLETHSRSLKTSPETKEQEDRRICREGQGWTAQEVALTFHCTPKRVTEARKADGRDPEWGKPLRPAIVHDATVIENVLRLSDAGSPVRQIALMLDKPKSTVQDVLKRHRGEKAA